MRDRNTLFLFRAEQANCALFGYAASMIGYDSHDIHWVSNGYHAWVDIDGLIYDPSYTESSYNTLVYGYTYLQGERASAFLGAGYSQMTDLDGTYQYIRVPRIQ